MHHALCVTGQFTEKSIARLGLISHSSGEGEMAEGTLQRIEENVFAHVGPEGESNQGLVVTREGSILVDNYIRYFQSLSKFVRRVSGTPVRFVINTHSDIDHFSANHYFRREGALILASSDSRARIETMMATQRWVEELKSRSPDLAHDVTDPREAVPHMSLEGRTTLSVGGEVMECIPMGHGHCPGDMVVYMPQRKILFSGDLVFVGQHGRLKTADLNGLVQTLDRILQRPIESLVPGHGEPVVKGGREAVAVYRDYVVTLQREVCRLHTAGLGLDEIKEQLRDWKYAHWGRNRLFPVCIEHVYRDVVWRKRFSLP